MANLTSGKTVKGERLHELFEEIRSDGITDAAGLAFLCIGTDRSSGDALGPLTGTLLSEAGYPVVIGTLDRPCDADTWDSRLAELPPGLVVVAVDACLGNAFSVGLFQIRKGALEAGRSMRRRLQPVGHYSVAAIMAENRANPMRVLETTPLGRVWAMSRQIVGAVQHVFPIR